jgi:hypothetical protein
MKIHEFYRRFEDMPKEERYALIEFTPEPSSFFVIFQKLTQIKQQKRRLEEQEEHLLDQAEEALKKKRQ